MEDCVLQRQYRNMKNKECHKAAVLALHVRVACGCIHDAHGEVHERVSDELREEELP